MQAPKLRNNPMEKKAKREIEKMRNPWQTLKNTTEEIEEHIRKKELCSNNKKPPPAAD